MKTILKYGQLTYDLSIFMGHGAFTHPFVKVNVYKFRYNSDVASSKRISIIADDDSPLLTEVKLGYNCENVFNKDATFDIKEFFSKNTSYTSFITTDKKRLFKALNNVPLLLLRKFHCNFLLTRQGNRECYRKNFINEIQKRINLT